MRRHILFALFGALVASSAFAADAVPENQTAAIATHALVLPTGASMVAASDTVAVNPTTPKAFKQSRGMDPRRPVLLALHGMTGLIQAYDGVSTLRVLRAGGYEANPLMGGVAGNEKALFLTKMGAAAATIIGTETLWHDNHKVAAIVVSLVANSAMAAIANHNAQVLKTLR